MADTGKVGKTPLQRFAGQFKRQESAEAEAKRPLVSNPLDPEVRDEIGAQNRLKSLMRKIDTDQPFCFSRENFGNTVPPSLREQHVYTCIRTFMEETAKNAAEKETLLRQAQESLDSRLPTAQRLPLLRDRANEIERTPSSVRTRKYRIQLNNQNSAGFQQLLSAVNCLCESEKFYSSTFYDYIFRAQREPEQMKKVFSSDLIPIELRLQNVYYLFPDFILMADKDDKTVIDVLKPSALQISVSIPVRTAIYDLSEQCYRGKTVIGSDSYIIRSGPETVHYAHERKDGRPDARYTENPVISRTREDMAEIGKVSVTLNQDSAFAEFSSLPAAEALRAAAQAYCGSGRKSSNSALFLLDLLKNIEAGPDSIAAELYEKYSRFLENNNPVCGIITTEGV